MAPTMSGPGQSAPEEKPLISSEKSTNQTNTPTSQVTNYLDNQNLETPEEKKKREEKEEKEKQKKREKEGSEEVQENIFGGIMSSYKNGANKHGPAANMASSIKKSLSGEPMHMSIKEASAVTRSTQQATQAINASVGSSIIASRK